MLRPICTGIFIILLSVVCFAQDRFNIVDTAIGGASMPDLFHMDGNNLFIAAQSNLDFTVMDLGRFDKNGALLQHKEIKLDSSKWLSNCGKCLKHLNGSFYFAYNAFVAADSAFVVFNKLNANLDTLKTSWHSSFQSSQPLIRVMKADSDSTFLVAGLCYREPQGRFKYDLWIGRVDTSFNFLWQDRITDNYQNFFEGYCGYDIQVDQYGSFLVTGNLKIDNGAGGNLLIEKSFIGRFDVKTGSKFWLKEFDGIAASQDIFCLNAGEGKYYFAENEIYNYFLNSDIHDSARIRFGVIDTSGALQWDSIILKTNTPFYISDLIFAKDSNLYLSGTRRIKPANFMSAGYKFSWSGDSIWYRSYYYDDSADYSEIWAFTPIADSGYIHVGPWVDVFDPKASYIQTWILRTDKYGCVIDGCQSMSHKYFDKLQSSIFIYPNPNNSGMINIDGLKDLVGYLTLIDSQGRYLKQIGINEIQVLHLDVSNLKSGVYFLNFISEDGSSIVEKIIIQ